MLPTETRFLKPPLIKYKSGALVTQFLNMVGWVSKSKIWPSKAFFFGKIHYISPLCRVCVGEFTDVIHFPWKMVSFGRSP